MTLPFIIAGLVSGSVIGLAAVGLALTYKTSGIFNFAHGAVATLAAYAFYELNVQHGMRWPLAAVISIVGVGVIVGLLFERLAKVLAKRQLAMQIVATVGIFLLIQGSIALIYGFTEVRSVPQYLPIGTHEVFGAVVSDDQIIIMALALVLTVALYVVMKFTRLGVAMRAMVDNPELLSSAGTNPDAVRRCAWVIGLSFAATSGVLIAPRQPDLTGSNLTLLVMESLGAAALGAFASLPFSFLGGLAIGIGSALSSRYFTQGILLGLAPTLSYVVLFVAMIVFPKRLLVAGAKSPVEHRSRWNTPWQIQVVSGIAIVTLLLFVPQFAGVQLTAWTRAVADIVGLLGLGLLVRTSGQVSLGHVAFLAIGACGLSHLAVDHGLPWGFALFPTGLLTIPISALLAVPAVRLSGLYLALATLGFGFVLSYMFYGQKFMFGTNGEAILVPRPSVGWIDLSSDSSFFYLCLAFAALAVSFTIAVTRSRLGRLLGALADSPTALATGGASGLVSQVAVFCIAGFMVAISGALGAAAQTSASPSSFPPLNSLLYLAVIMFTVGREPWYAIQGAFGLWIVQAYFQGEDVPYWLMVLFGIVALQFALGAEAMAKQQQFFARVLDPIFRKSTSGDTKPSKDGIRAEDQEIHALVPVEPVELTVQSLRVTFGGLVAVDGVSLTAPSGRVTGLIGPNGAGKTTLFNSCSGLNRPTSGRVLMGGRDISRRSVAARARRGVGRTFQQMQLYDSLTVFENVSMGREAWLAGHGVMHHIVASPSEVQQTTEAAIRSIRECGLEELRDLRVGSLSTGQRRLVELARCLAGEPRVMLLDEPSSGLDPVETARFGEILRKVVEKRNLGILLVEHDMELVMRISDYIYVLDFGKLIFEGAPREVRRSEVVRKAYLGEEIDDQMNGIGIAGVSR